MQLVLGLETACSSLRLYPKSKGQTRSRGQGDREEALLYLQRCWIYKIWSRRLNFYTRPNCICRLYLVEFLLLSFGFFVSVLCCKTIHNSCDIVGANLAFAHNGGQSQGLRRELSRTIAPTNYYGRLCG